MEYSKIQSEFTRAVTFMSAEPASRGVWVSLIAFCAEKENGGRIARSSTWNDRQWMACCCVSKAEVAAMVQAELGRWDGEDLIVIAYDQCGEIAYDKRRALGRTGGVNSGASRRRNTSSIASTNASTVPSSKPEAHASRLVQLSASKPEPNANPRFNPSPLPLPLPGEGTRVRAPETPPPDFDSRLKIFRELGIDTLDELHDEWLRDLGDLSENHVIAICRGWAVPTRCYPSDWRERRDGWSKLIRERNEAAAVDAGYDARKADERERRLRAAAQERETIEPLRAILGDLVADQLLAARVSGKMPSALIQLRSAIDSGRGNGLLLLRLKGLINELKQVQGAQI